MPKENKQENKPERMFAATFAPHNGNAFTPAWSLSEDNANIIDKMEVPDDFQKVIELCRFFYEHDGIANNVINKQVDIGINGYNVDPKTCSDNELLVYQYVDDELQRFLKNAALEYLLSGLVIPEATWERVPGVQIHPRLRGTYEVPTSIWLRDPKSIELRKTPLPNRLLVLVKLSEEDRYFIENKGEYMDGFQDKETYQILKEQYPDFVDAVRNNKGKEYFKLENTPVIIRRNVKSGSVYPTPYLKPALELFMHKRNLRKMDYAIAARVISAIQLFKLGNDEYPLTESDEDIVADLKKQIRWRGKKYNKERVFQLFSNHTLDIEWVTPDTKTLLSDTKYQSVNEDILAALGIPRIVVSGETMRSGTSSSEIAMLPPINTIESLRSDLLEYPKYLYEEIKERNGLSGIPQPKYPPIRLQSLDELVSAGQVLYEDGIISRTDFAEMANLDFDAVMERMKLEREKMEEHGLKEYAPVPYSPEPQDVGKNQQEPNQQEPDEGNKTEEE
jgi:hypothetical protein